MKGREVRTGLVERVEELLRETRCRVRVGDEEGGSFWTARGVRQGCPLSPMLFNLVLADLEEEMGKVRWGGVVLGEERIYSLSYADDIVLLAEEEGEMRSMIERLECYMDRKGLEVNAGKTKVMRFRKGGGRWKRVRWKWKGRGLEEVKEFDYLGYRFQTNGGQEAHLRERIRKAASAMGQVWGIGKRRFGKDWGRRVWLFDRLVWTVMGYGAEVWGWKEREGIERVHERFLRWVLGVEGRTPGYLVREELQREMMRSRAARIAWGFEKRLEEGRGGDLARRCLMEIRGRAEKQRVWSKWEEERREFFQERGVGAGRAGGWEEEGEGVWEEVERKEREMQERERWERIRSSRYNRWYGEVKGKGLPEYLKKGWGESRWRRVARFRLGNEIRERMYWGGEEEKGCRLCGGGIESWEHVWEECRSWRERGGESWQEVFSWILGEKGEGENWMRELERERGGAGGREEGSDRGYGEGGEEREGAKEGEG
ncbi:uncharacterized protein LOC113004505 [Solenopsis invicta]|uniref:uncharacterized protein LOC113004505 n=1 Tax=Solenopsis invicta TaxID=13686 RepID=UPI00193CEB77|nr:uncharacterized protein LOC113004505 [Solenopsis invicta]